VLATDNAGSATLNLDGINGWPISVFNFAGTNSNPAAYVVSATGLTFPTNPAGNPLAAGDYLGVNGLSSAFGSAPPDFIASGLNGEASIPATMQVLWTTAGNAAPFATATATSLSVNLTNAALISASVLVAGESIDMTTLPASPSIMPAADANDATSALPVFRPLFSVGSVLVGIQSFNTLAPFETAAAAEFAATPANPASKFLAHGFFNRATNIFTASRIDVVL
jgi:hypothetical protein